MRKLTTEEFIKKAKYTHGDKYNYNLVEYINAITKVIIVCKTHGKFKIDGRIYTGEKLKNFLSNYFAQYKLDKAA